ncbi:hypothetical protein SO802_028902 [Lithocarpus litseifolius]|uniref:RNase H type-1 domain-containing protein n=1 Tax=Lithocarpus litseifolius TaxID=425828 RepID=A0AAW2BT49_9ROSI
MVAMPILRSGCCWKVGNGEDIWVKKDKWIPNYPSNKVLHQVVEEEEEWRVSVHIDPDLHCWRRELIMASSQRDDAAAICKIPLSRRQCLVERLPKLELELFVTQAWIIWYQRNTMVHGVNMRELGWLNRRAAEYLDEHKKAQENLMITSTTASRLVWQAPPPAEYKLNFDATVFPKLQCSGFGAIIRNANEEVRAGMSAKGPYEDSSEEAEVMACRKAIEFSLEAGFARLIIEGDRLNVNNNLSDFAEKSPFLAIYMMI